MDPISNGGLCVTGHDCMSLDGVDVHVRAVVPSVHAYCSVTQLTSTNNSHKPVLPEILL